MEYVVERLKKMCGESQFVWKIDGFRRKYNEAAAGVTSALYSPPFETHKYGYKMALSFCPYGDGRGQNLENKCPVQITVYLEIIACV